MSKNVERLLTQAEKLLYEFKLDQVFEILQNIDNMGKLSEKEKLSYYIVKSRYLIFTGEYKKAYQLLTYVFDESSYSSHHSYENQLKQLDIICLRANALWRLGNCDASLNVIQKGEEILETITTNDSSFYRVKANILTEKACIFPLQGKISQALELLHEAMSLYEKSDSLRDISYIHNLLGLLHKDLGDLDIAINHFNKCIDICKKIGTKRPMHFAKLNLGVVYMIQGDLDLALESFLGTVKVYEETGDIFNLTGGYEHISRIYQFKGDVDSALMYLNEALKLGIKLGHSERQSKIYYRLVILAIEHDLLELAQKYLQALQKINKREKNRLIDQRYRFSHALLLGARQRIFDFVNAQKILKQITQEEIIDDEINIFALINLCKLLLKEVQLFGNNQAIFELQDYSRQFLERANKYNSFVLRTEAYILQSRIALINWDTSKAKELLTQATLIAREKNLKKLLLEITKEKALLAKRIEIGKKYHLQKSSLRERVKLAQLDDIITRIVYNETSQIMKQNEELSDFAHQMAHDLRRNITNVLGFAELIKIRGYDERLVKIIVNNAKTMNDLLVHSVELAEAGLIVESIDEVDLNHLVESVALMHLPPEVVLTHNDLPILVCDRNKISQIFKNLFENAMIHGKTTKTISVTRTDYKDRMTLIVSNDGLPIPKDLSNEIFQRGYTTKKGNTGLGLTIVKKLVEAHGWHISLKPAPHTTFRISIPILLHTEQRIKEKSYI